MMNVELINKVLTDEELNLVAGGGPRVRVPLRGPSFKQIKDVIGTVHNAKKVITCLIKKIFPPKEPIRTNPIPHIVTITNELHKMNDLPMSI